MTNNVVDIDGYSKHLGKNIESLEVVNVPKRSIMFNLFITHCQSVTVQHYGLGIDLSINCGLPSPDEIATGQWGLRL